MSTFHIHICGQVQGVGFRPHVYRLAQQFNLAGSVSNATDGVHIEVNGVEAVVRKFLSEIIGQAPPHARIESHKLTAVDSRVFTEFKIADSQRAGNNKIRLTPDFSICSNCNEELTDINNRRHGYGFITCTQCGPRYSIQRETPYDRHKTTMASFSMCDACLKEYNDPSDPRFYSQTNSCTACGIKLSLFDKNSNELSTDSPIEFITKALKEGKIVAAKGIGGYLLLCDASNDSVIKTLRQRKSRPKKPLAVMYPNMVVLKVDLIPSSEEERLLQTPESPIVLIECDRAASTAIAKQQIAPGLNKIGVMMPYAPLLKLIADDFGRPLIATSGNISGAPITYNDEDALSLLSDFADLIVTHNRVIIVPQDDSVVQVVKEKSILLRRSRGYAPSYFGPMPGGIKDGVIAMGSDLKGSIGMSHEGQWHVSQFLGNQESYEAQLAYDKVLQHLLHLTGVKPTYILVDQHPGYYTTQKGKSWADEMKMPVFPIQHHEAHFAAVLQENNLIESDDPVLGVIWDGTGHGSDGNSWGGEFFEYSNYKISRTCHLDYVPLLAGDKMAREPRLSAMAFCARHKEAGNLLQNKFSNDEYTLYTKMLNHPESSTCSMGRMFDAVASLLGLCDVSTYEGEAALYLQNLAETNKDELNDGYQVLLHNNSISTASIMAGIVSDILRGHSKSGIAMKFHLTLVGMIKLIATSKKYNEIAFSGGVFQNKLLIDLIVEGLGDFKLYFHKELPPNDENISFGQLAHFHLQQTIL